MLATSLHISHTFMNKKLLSPWVLFSKWGKRYQNILDSCIFVASTTFNVKIQQISHVIQTIKPEAKKRWASIREHLLWLLIKKKKEREGVVSISLFPFGLIENILFSYTILSITQSMNTNNLSNIFKTTPNRKRLPKYIITNWIFTSTHF